MAARRRARMAALGLWPEGQMHDGAMGAWRMPWLGAPHLGLLDSQLPPSPPWGVGATWPGEGSMCMHSWAHGRRRTTKSMPTVRTQRVHRRRDVVARVRGHAKTFQLGQFKWFKPGKVELNFKISKTKSCRTHIHLQLLQMPTYQIVSRFRYKLAWSYIFSWLGQTVQQSFDCVFECLNLKIWNASNWIKCVLKKTEQFLYWLNLKFYWEILRFYQSSRDRSRALKGLTTIKDFELVNSWLSFISDWD
jgi:hypothetical protein